MNTRDICLHSGKTILFCIAMICGCGPAHVTQSNTAAYVPVTNAMIQSPPPGDWLMLALELKQGSVNKLFVFALQ